MQELLKSLLPTFKLALSPNQISAMEIYIDMLRKWQKKVNLISEPSLERLLQFHFLESFWMAKHFLSDGTVLTDLGAGAGFPGLAAKIYRPTINLTLIEKKATKAFFLETLIRQLRLKKVSVCSLRWEKFQGWSLGNTVCIRALKPSKALLQKIYRKQQILLLLHSSELRLEWAKYNIIKKLSVPGSRERMASKLFLK